MTPERLAGLRGFGPFPAIQVAPSRTDEDTIDLLSNPANVVPGGPVGALSYHGGATLQHPKLVALYAGAPYVDRAKNDQFLREVMTFGYLSALSGQGSGNGVFLGSFDVPHPATAWVTDGDCQTIISSAIAANSALPRPDGETIYMLILPDGVSVGDGMAGNSSCTAFCGYHSSNAELLYTVQPATTCATCNQGDPFVALTMVEAHEIAESCSDPHGTGWYNDATGMENADECAWVQVPYGPWIVQGYAAQDAAGTWINTVGAYSPVADPQPQPQPGPQPGPPPGPPPQPRPFVPDPLVTALLAWQVAECQWIANQYAAADIDGVRAQEAVLIEYAQSVAGMVAARVAASAPPAPPELSQ